MKTSHYLNLKVLELYQKDWKAITITNIFRAPYPRPSNVSINNYSMIRQYSMAKLILQHPVIPILLNTPFLHFVLLFSPNQMRITQKKRQKCWHFHTNSMKNIFIWMREKKVFCITIFATKNETEELSSGFNRILFFGHQYQPDQL